MSMSIDAMFGRPPQQQVFSCSRDAMGRDHTAGKLPEILANKYHTLRTLGAGAMGIVVEAENIRTGKRVAVKLLANKHAGDEEAAKLMQREVAAASALNHPNVVDIYDLDYHEGSPFIVMELLVGESLAALLDRGRLPVSELLGLLLDAMRGVGAAHAAGIVHRDLKPDNIFLASDPDGRPIRHVKVVDFGISKLIESGAQSLTKTGTIRGTPHYMSWEQLSGEPVDARSDVYAFGVMLYEGLTGQMPYAADTFNSLIVRIVNGPAPQPLCTLRPELSPELERIVHKALATEVTERYASIAALRSDLEPFLNDSSSRSSHTPVAFESTQRVLSRPVRTSARALWLVAAGSLIALGGFGISRGDSASPTRSAPQPTASTAEVNSKTVAQSPAETQAPAPQPEAAPQHVEPVLPAGPLSPRGKVKHSERASRKKHAAPSSAPPAAPAASVEQTMQPSEPLQVEPTPHEVERSAEPATDPALYPAKTAMQVKNFYK